MMHCGYFDTTRKGDHSATLTPTVADGRRPRETNTARQTDRQTRPARFNKGYMGKLFGTAKAKSFIGHVPFLIIC